MPRTARDLVEDALARVTSLEVSEARARLGRPGVAFVDLREPAELQAHGTIPGALHAPRGLIEFWFDPASPWHRPEFAGHAELVLFCAAGWRSALAARTLGELGLPGVSHVREGFNAWAAAGGPVAAAPGGAEPPPDPAPDRTPGAGAPPPRID
jgi:rhodanese-related sulfurtransferase